MGLRDKLSKDKQVALVNLEKCKKIGEQFEVYLKIFIEAVEDQKLKIDKKKQEQLIGSMIWAIIAIMLVTDMTREFSKTVAKVMELESNKILLMIKKYSKKIGFSNKIVEGVLKKIYPTFKTDPYTNAVVSHQYWREIMNQVKEQKIKSNNIDKKWNQFFNSINFG